MRLRRRFVLAILLYLTLDLSLASMPGAFVFEVDDSVESAQMTRVRQMAEVTPDFAPTRAPKVVVIRAEVRPRSATSPESATPVFHGERPRTAIADPPASSEDPH